MTQSQQNGSQESPLLKRITLLDRLFSKTIMPDVKTWIQESVTGGLSEFEIFKRIQAEHTDLGITINLANTQALFPYHFLLFSHLYQWQEELSIKKQYCLSINALSIKLTKSTMGTEIGETDPMRDYYLNIKNLIDTSPKKLEDMLSVFWQRYTATDSLTTSFETLNMPPTKDYSEVKKQYKLQMIKHHPDKGGCSEKAKELNLAYKTIKQAFGKV